MASKTKSFSLRENIRERILKEMIANLKGKHISSLVEFLMVVDPHTIKIIGSSVRTVEILEEGVLAIERLDLQRKAFPETHALYFVSPTEQSITAIMKDFQDPGYPQYGNVHLFFTNRVPQRLFEKMRGQKALLERVLTFKELNVDFLTPEPNVFHFDMPEALPIVFSKQGQPETNALEEDIAQKLATVMLNLMKFDKFSVMYNINQQNKVSERVAKAVTTRLEKYFKTKEEEKSKAKKSNDYKPHYEDEDDLEPVKVVILDRTVDPLTPALMDYYYESMVFEFLNIKGNIVEYEDEVQGQIVKKKAILDDNDELWEKHRYKFIMEAMLAISHEWEDFVKNNLNAPLQKREDESTDIHELAETLKKMPIAKELQEKYQIHMNLISKIIQFFNNERLKELGDLEQTLATSVNSQGVELRNADLTSELVKKKAQLKLDNAAKLRLMIITSFVLKLNDSERNLLTQDLSKEGKEIISRLSWLGLGGEKSLIKGKVNKNIKEKPNLPSDKQKSIPVNLCRYIPSIDSLAQNVIVNKIDAKQYNTISYPSSYNGILTIKKNVNKRDIDVNKLPKVVFFIIGGMTHSEVRVLNELSMANPYLNVVAGSTALISVKDYLKGIGQMTSKGNNKETNLEDNDDDDLDNSRDY